MEIQLEHRHPLDGLRFDVLDAVDEKKMVLVITDDLALHLSRRHAAVRLNDVHDRDAEAREDVGRGSPERQDGAGDDRNRYDENRERAAKGQVNEPHDPYPPPGRVCARKGPRSPDARESRSKARRTSRRANASSISVWASTRCASATSTTGVSPLW